MKSAPSKIGDLMNRSREKRADDMGAHPKNLYLEVRRALQLHGYREYSKRTPASVGTALRIW